MLTADQMIHDRPSTQLQPVSLKPVLSCIRFFLLIDNGSIDLHRTQENQIVNKDEGMLNRLTSFKLNWKSKKLVGQSIPALKVFSSHAM